MSDLHLEFTGYEIAYLEPAGEDVVVLAGDIGLGCAGIQWAMRAIPDRPVIYVLGNHEFYKQDFNGLLPQARACAAGSNVHVLENDAVDLLGVRFLGCTLWTDFRSLGDAHREAAMQAASTALNDYSLISRGERRLNPQDTERRCLQSVTWLINQISQATQPVVVVTHHPPTLETISPYFAGTLGGAVFHNDFDAVIQAPVRAWIHGHTHHSVAKRIHGAQVVSNQRGYPRENLEAFRWDYVIVIDRV